MESVQSASGQNRKWPQIPEAAPAWSSPAATTSELPKSAWGKSGLPVFSVALRHCERRSAARPAGELRTTKEILFSSIRRCTT
jgi:hypothetical protein